MSRSWQFDRGLQQVGMGISVRDGERTAERGRKVGALGEFVRKRGNSRIEELADGVGGREVRDFRVGRGTTRIVGRLAARAGGEGCSGDLVMSSGSGGEFGRGGRKAGCVEP